MIGKLFSFILDMIISLISVILSPIDSLIASALPSVDSALSSIAGLFSYVSGVIGYVVDASGISDVALALIVSYWTFVLTSTISVAVVKQALSWYKALKP